MVGKHKGVYAFLKKENDNIYLAACPCHLLHHAAERGAAALPFLIDEILTDIYYYLEKSSKRLASLEEFQMLHSVEHHTILKHVPTRWLSVFKCLNRLIENWIALKAFFAAELSQQKSSSTSHFPPRLVSINSFFKSGSNLMYCLFLQYALKPFHDINERLQSEGPQIHSLKRTLCMFLSDLFARFVKPAARFDKAVTDVKFEEHQVPDSDLMIGQETKVFLAGKRDAGKLNPEKLKMFYGSVRKFNLHACRYILKKLPITDTLLSKAELVNVDNRMNTSRSDIDYFLDRYQCILPEGTLLKYRQSG